MKEQELDQIHIDFSSDSTILLNICLAIIMFGIALEIRRQDFQRLKRHPRAALIGTVGQFILLPAFTFIFILFMQPQASIALGLILVGACPGGNISNFLSHFSGSNSALSVSLTGIATLLSLIMTPLNFEFYAWLYPPTRELLKGIFIDPWSVIETITIIMGIPLISGLLVQQRFPHFADRLGPILRKLSILIFIAFVGVALANNFTLFQNYIHEVLLVVFLHNALALALGYYWAQLTRLSRRDSRTLSLEMGIQNAGLGLVLVFTFFSGMGGMALVTAWWGIWHITAGLTLAFYWNRHPALPEHPAGQSSLEKTE